MISKTVEILSVAGRATGFAGAALTVSVIVVGIVEWVILSFRYGFEWDAGIIPLVAILQILLAIWVVWRVFKAEPTSLLYTLLLAFGFSFFVLYGWYFLLIGEGGELIAAGNLLYLAAGFIVLCARLTARLNAHFEHSSP